MIKNFAFTPFPQIYFGEGEFLKLPQKLAKRFKNILLLTGGKSLRENGTLEEFCCELEANAISYIIEQINCEPGPELIDGIVKLHKNSNIDLVLAVGGGSVLDAGKALAAMMPLNDSIIHYLEGVGTKEHPGTSLPFAAVPTTAGTGSEATKNAVISEIGEKGFKKSLRHDNFIPDFAVLDPALMLSCPQNLTAACGLDAITQLLESYVSTNASPITDALAFGALEKAIPAFPNAVLHGEHDVEARTAMAYAALISGITLANAGLGIVHGFASPIGGFFDIPHGVVCGTLLPSATEVNVKRLQEQTDAEHQNRLKKHVKVARIFQESKDLNDEDALNFMVRKFYSWADDFKIPKLRFYNIKEKDIPRIISASAQKNNPVKLSEADLREILVKRI